MPPFDTGLPPPSVPLFPTSSVLAQNYPDIDEVSIELFDYFCNTQSHIMTVSPQNNFTRVFASMAVSSRPVLYGILAWAGFHKNDSVSEQLAKKHIENASALILQDNLGITYSREEVLATLLLIASSHICSGDVVNWRKYLALAAAVIKKHGGLSSFMQSDSVTWLLKNFAYHEILSSSSTKTPLLFSPQDYSLILLENTSQMPDTLCACCQPLFAIIANITNLARHVRELCGTPGSNISLAAVKTITEFAADLENQIYQAQPNESILYNLGEKECKIQFILFEAFQHVSVLYLYNSVLHMSSGALQVRSINELLLAAIDSVMGSTVEGILAFPLFIAGVTCCVQETRPDIILRFEQLFIRNQARNIRQAQLLLDEVWVLDQFGTRYVDWNSVAESKGWHLSFA